MDWKECGKAVADALDVTRRPLVWAALVLCSLVATWLLW